MNQREDLIVYDNVQKRRVDVKSTIANVRSMESRTIKCEPSR
jgi:hypothetical protein